MASRSPSQDVEILVHTTAPSRAADDVAYRQLAQAYLAFQPSERSILPTLPSPSSVLSSVQKSALLNGESGSISGPSHAATCAAAAGPEFAITSQDISFWGVVDNLASPRLQFVMPHKPTELASQGGDVGSQTSWEAPPSQISDSYPMPDAELLQTSPSRVLRRYVGEVPSLTLSLDPPSPSRSRPISPQGVNASIDVPSSLPIPEDEDEDTSLPVELPGYIKVRPAGPIQPQPPKKFNHVDITTATDSNALPPAFHGFPMTPESVVPVTPHLLETKASTGATVGIDEPEQDRECDVTHISNSESSASPLDATFRDESEPPPAKRPRVASIQHRELVRSSSDVGPVTSSSTQRAKHNNSGNEIRAPSPPVGINMIDPADLVSEKMAKLARDLWSRYRPEPMRELDPFERGYWLLDCTSWSPDIWNHAWGFLTNYLQNGSAGWGTWARRDEAHSWIRLYCWGHVAKHMYLVLYLASARVLKTTGANWIGGDGETMVRVPPLKRQV